MFIFIANNQIKGDPNKYTLCSDCCRLLSILQLDHCLPHTEQQLGEHPQMATIFTFQGEGVAQWGRGWDGMRWRENPAFPPCPGELFVWLHNTFTRSWNKNQNKRVGSQPNYNRCPAHSSTTQSMVWILCSSICSLCSPVKHVSHTFSLAFLQRFPKPGQLCVTP